MLQREDCCCLASYFAKAGSSSCFVSADLNANISLRRMSLSNCILLMFYITFSAFNAYALGALAEVAGSGLDAHLGTILPALLSALGGDDLVYINVY